MKTDYTESVDLFPIKIEIQNICIVSFVLFDFFDNILNVENRSRRFEPRGPTEKTF